MGYPHFTSDCHEHHELVRDFGGAEVRPRIVCLCGSTRFFDAFRAANLRLTLAGEIVLSIGCDTKSDADLGIIAGDLAPAKAALDDLHKRKIDLADYVLALNVGGYIGESTRSEVNYALSIGRPVTWLEPESIPAGFAEFAKASAIAGQIRERLAELEVPGA